MEYTKERIDNLEKEIQTIKNIIQKYQQINIDEQNPISKDNNTAIDIETEKNNLIPYKHFEPNNQTVYCQCCNFTNSCACSVVMDLVYGCAISAASISAFN